MSFRRRQRQADEPRSPKTEPLNEGEIKWRADQVEIACLLAVRYVGRADALPRLEDLALIVSGWLEDDDSRSDINTVVSSVGIAFGEHLASRSQLGWVIATDEQGSDLALLGQPGDILIFPANAVAKRLAAGESGFVLPLFDAMVSTIDELRQAG